MCRQGAIVLAMALEAYPHAALEGRALGPDEIIDPPADVDSRITLAL